MGNQGLDFLDSPKAVADRALVLDYLRTRARVSGDTAAVCAQKLVQDYEGKIRELSSEKIPAVVLPRIELHTRDVNGMRTEHVFRGEHSIYTFLTNDGLSDEEEVLLLIQDGICLYSALQSDHALTAEDMIGFFA